MGLSFHCSWSLRQESITLSSGSDTALYLTKRSAYAPQCGTSSHRALTFVATVLVILWPVGMVALFITVLFKNRKELSHGVVQHPFARATKFLTGGYKPK